MVVQASIHIVQYAGDSVQGLAGGKHGGLAAGGMRAISRRSHGSYWAGRPVTVQFQTEPLRAGLTAAVMVSPSCQRMSSRQFTCDSPIGWRLRWVPARVAAGRRPGGRSA